MVSFPMIFIIASWVFQIISCVCIIFQFGFSVYNLSLSKSINPSGGSKGRSMI